jgi:hypothetical protein
MSVRVDFSLASSPKPYTCSLERKAGQVVKTFRARTVSINNGQLRLYTPKSRGLEIPDANLLSAVDLMGCTVSRKANTSEVKVFIRGAKEPILLRGKNSLEVEDFERELRKEVTRMNSLALAAGSREPELVEWYYTCKDSISRQSGKLRDVPQKVSMRYSIPGQTEDRTAQFKLTVSGATEGLRGRDAEIKRCREDEE